MVSQATNDEDFLRIVRKYLIHGIPHVFANNPEVYYDFREKIALHWNVGFQEVLIMGISIAELQALKLKVEDYSQNTNLRPLIREYYNAMDEYVRMKNINLFIQNRVFL